MPKPFRESFFERIIDVQWDTEPKVFWMAGSGHWNIVNSSILGDHRAWVFTSADGKNWKGKDYGLKSESDWGFGAFYGGGWMRNGLEPGAQATWVLVGSDGRFLSGSAAAASIDGLTISSTQFFDRWHHCEGLFPLSSSVETLSAKNAPNWHIDTFTSSDGKKWSPDHYDNITSGGLPPPDVAARAIEHAPYRSRALVSSTLVVPDTRLIVPEATPFDSSSGRQSKADQIVFNGNAIKASGKVQKGKYKGQVITCSLATFDSSAPAHGGPEIQITDAEGNTDTASCKVERTECINYGHYIFVVGGSIGGKSTVSWSDDGVNWHPKNLGSHSQINVLAVGPQK